MIDKRLTNKTFVYLFFLAVSLTAVFNLAYNNTAKEASIESLREQHALHLANSPFQETLQLSKAERKSKGIPPNKYQERMWELTMDPATGRPHPERLFALQASLRGAATTNKVPGGPEAYSSWQERGPNNVGGRTRALMFDPNDNTHKRVFAGGVSGGLWVNQDITDANSSWSLVDMPENLAVSCLAYDPNNTNTFYLGTGESYVSGGVNGNGVWKSTDAGNSWTQIFGGVTGETTFETNTKLSVDSPVSIAGDYVATSASFGPALTSTPLTGELVLADDGTAASTEACNPLINSAEVNGKIAVIKRGNCTFVSKVKNAQDAGAIAVLVINNVVGPPISMGGDDTTITIPAIMVSDEDGAAIINELANGVQVTMEKTDNPFGGTFVTPGIQHINDIKVRDVDGSTSEVYVAAGSAAYAASSPYTWLGLEQAGLYRSNNDGTSWSAVSLPLTSGGSNYAPNDIEIGADKAVWIATTNNPLGGEGGGTILHAADGLNFAVKHEINEGDRTQIALSGSNPDVVYVLGETGNSEVPITLLKTTDAFANVTETALPDDADVDIADNDFTRGQAFYDLMLEVDPTDDAILYAGGIDLFRSPDAGDSWDQISKWSNNNMLGSLNVSYVHADHHILVFNPGNPNQGIFGTDGGVFYGNDLASAPNNNQAIAARNKDYNTVQFYKGAVGAETAAEKLLAGAQDNGSHLINNATGGIAPSTHVTGGDGAYCFIDKDNEYMVTSYTYNNYSYLNYETGAWLYTIAGDDDGDFINPAGLDSHHNMLYTSATLSGSNTLYRISRFELGSNFASKTSLTDDLLTGTPTAFKPSAFTPSTLFVGTDNGKLLKLTDANGTPVWTDLTGDKFYGSISCVEQGASDNDLLVTFYNYGVTNVYYSSDGGNTWSAKENDLPDIPVNAIMMNPLNENEVILGTDLGVWATTNFMEANPQWTQSQNGMKNVKVTSFDLRTSDNMVLASTYGRGMFTAKFTVDNYEGDDDGDGVINGLDLCPDTPTGEAVNADGCSNDQADDDNDGVNNATDQCPNTPTGEVVDAHGCSNSQLDDDNDGVMNNVDQCPDTPAGEAVDANGCSDGQLDDDNDGVNNATDQCPDTPDGSAVNPDGCLVLPFNNFQLTVTGESCPDQHNGQLAIAAASVYNYVATINGTDHPFTNNLVISDLSPGNYTVCISIAAQQFEQCYQITLTESNFVTGKSSVKTGKASIEISTGTAPYSVYVNQEKVLETNDKKFNVSVAHGDALEVTSAALCEGSLKQVVTLLDGISAYPNPSRGMVSINLPMFDQSGQVRISLYNVQGQVVSDQHYTVANGKTAVSLEALPKGLYIARIHLENPVQIKLRKE